MRALATRPRRLALAVAMISAATLGTVSASAATTSGGSPRTVHTGIESGTTVVNGKSGKPGKPGKGKHLEPPKGAAFAVAYRPTKKAPDDVNTANDDFAACMRERGQKVFPDFHASKDAEGRVNLRVKVGDGDFDPTAAGYKKAVGACGPIMAKAGITFPDTSDLPPLPEPGKGHGPGRSLHIEPGKPGKPDLPSLTSGTETA